MSLFRRLIAPVRASRQYTVSGNGVAHRTAGSYLSDPKVLKALERFEKMENCRLPD